MPITGPSTDAGFDTLGYYGFSDNQGVNAGIQAASDHLITTLNVDIQSSSEAGQNVKFAIYESTDDVTYNLLEEVIYSLDPLAAAPQAVPCAGTNQTVTGRYYRLAWYFETNPGGNTVTWHKDTTTVASGGGTGNVTGTYATPADPWGSFTADVDGTVFWNLEGDAVSAEDLEISFQINEGGSPIADQNFIVSVFEDAGGCLGGTPLLDQITVATVSGVMTINDQALVSVGNLVWVNLRKQSEADGNFPGVNYHATVYDANA